MGLGGINLTQLLVVLAIVLVVFGTKRVKSLGTDLGGAIKGFRNAMEADDRGTADTGRRQLVESATDADPAADSSARNRETHGGPRVPSENVQHRPF